MADEASDNDGQPGAGEPYEDAEQDLADELNQDLFRRTLRDVCGLTPNQLDVFYTLNINSPDALALFDKELLTALYHRGANTGIWRKFTPAKQMKVHPLYGWLRHKRDQEDIDLKTLDLSLFTLDVMKDLRKTQSRTKEYSRKKDKDVIDNILKATTQLARRIGTGALTRRRYSTKIKQLWYRRLNVRIYGDTMKAATKSSRGNKYAHLMCSANGLYFMHPMPVKSDASTALEKFFRKFGIMTNLHTDNAPELTAGDYRKTANDHTVNCTSTEPHSPWQNRVEPGINKVQKHT
jgi:hypothetical protein